MAMKEVASCPAAVYDTSSTLLLRFLVGGGVGSWSLFSVDEPSELRIWGTIRDFIVKL